MTKKIKQIEQCGIRSFKPKTKNQSDYIRAIVENQIIIAIGMAGTGKTAVATAIGCEHLFYEKVKKLIITRPAVEAGKSLGFQPGTMHEKMQLYMIPIIEELNLSVGRTLVQQWLREEKIEILPLNFMRGRTFNDCFCICDEMSNATYSELKLLLTRIGMNSKIILTGDLKQSDLHPSEQGGLQRIATALANVEDISIINLYEQDIIRNPLISKILEKLP